MIQEINGMIHTMVYIVLSLGPAFGVFLIVLESMIPILPLAAFIALNMLAFGTGLGFILSWLATSLGCVIAYYIFRKGYSDKLYKRLKIGGKTHAFLNAVKRLSFPNLVLLIALPFTPAFAVNIACGLSKMHFKKFLLAILIGKPFMVYFWGYIGTSFLDSITDIHVIIKVGAMLAVAYAASRIIQLKFNIKE